MPSIKILEKDLTTSGRSEVTSNAVYIPGYAIMGAVNKPIYCTSLSQFKSIFGTKPYKFRENTTPISFNTPVGSNSNVAAIKDTYEKSYIYATELLNKGLPVLFERYFDNGSNDSNLIAWTGIGVLAGTTAQTVILTKSNLDEAKALSIETNKTFYDRSGEEGSYVYTASDPQPSYSTSGTYYVKTATSPATYEEVTLTSSNYDNTKTYYEKNDSGYYVAASVDYTSEGTYYLGTAVTSAITMKSKVPGYATTNIKYKLSYDTNTKIYTLNIDQILDEVLGTPSASEKIEFTLSNKDVTYYKNIESNLVDFTFADELITITTTGDTSIALVVTGTGDEFSIASIYDAFSSAGTTQNPNIFTKLKDKSEYNIKFITSGAYPVFNYTNDIVKYMLETAGSRADSIALIDHPNYTSWDLVSSASTSLIKLVNALSNNYLADTTNEDCRKYGAMFTPWATYSTMNNSTSLPASFAYLYCYALSIANNPSWYAVAGVSRGLAINLEEVAVNITGAMSEILNSDDGISINPIINIKPYGYCIWGNRTLNKNSNGLIASSFLNIRSLVSDVKKVLYATCKALTFENNTDVLWLNFKAAIEPTLDKMITGNGLTGYKLIKETTDTKGTLKATVRLQTVEAIENWDITVELTDSYVSVE